MKIITIAFDVDDTLRGKDMPHNGTIGTGAYPRATQNKNVVDLLKILSGMQNTRIIVWSGGGANYAETICRQFGITEYVDEYMSKITANMNGYKPDIAVDDMTDVELGVLNLIV